MKSSEHTPGQPQHIAVIPSGFTFGTFAEGAPYALGWTTGRTQQKGHQVYCEVICYRKTTGRCSTRPDWIYIGRIKLEPVTDEALKHMPQAEGAA